MCIFVALKKISMSKRYTITAALPYTNGPIHIGHLAGVYVPADIYARYLRLKGNDVAFYNKVFEESGYADTRYLGRGTINWTHVDQLLADETSLGFKLYHEIKNMIGVRSQHPAFGRGSLSFLEFKNSLGIINSHILSYQRSYEKDTVYIIK